MRRSWIVLVFLLVFGLLSLNGACGDDDDDDDASDDDLADDDTGDDDAVDDDTVDDDTADDDTERGPPFEACVEAMTWYAADEGCGIVWHDDGDGSPLTPKQTCSVIGSSCALECVNEWGCDAGDIPSNDCFSSVCGADG